MEKKQFSTQTIFLIISAVVFALICAIAFWPQAQTLDDQESVDLNQEISTMEGDTMSQELIIEDMQVGTGPAVQAGDNISIHYHGTLEDGTVFDSSVDRGTPFETQIGVGMLIQGWDQGIPGMQVGGKRRLTIPADLAYGNQAIGNIPAGSTLIFDVELLEIQ